MTDNTGEVSQSDELTLEDMLYANLIVSMRIYDVQMALLAHFDEEDMVHLNTVHESGRVVGSMPYLKTE